MGTTGVLEAIGAIVIGGIFLVMMFNAYYNVNVSSYNISMQVTLNDMTERVTSLLDSIYLSKVGAGTDTSIVAITTAAQTKFEYLGLNSPDDDSLNTICIEQGIYDSLQDAFPLWIKVNGLNDAGPFWMSKAIVFEYYDVNENLFTYTDLLSSTNRDLVRSLKLDLELFFVPLTPNAQQSEIKHNIIFWKYFKNLYLIDT